MHYEYGYLVSVAMSLLMATHRNLTLHWADWF